MLENTTFDYSTNPLNLGKIRYAIQFSFLTFHYDVLVILGCCQDGGEGFLHWSLHFGLTWRLYWLADTKSNENADKSFMLAISDSLILSHKRKLF